MKIVDSATWRTRGSLFIAPGFVCSLERVVTVPPGQQVPMQSQGDMALVA